MSSRGRHRKMQARARKRALAAAWDRWLNDGSWMSRMGARRFSRDIKPEMFGPSPVVTSLLQAAKDEP